jgi:hypothetical protein
MNRKAILAAGVAFFALSTVGALADNASVTYNLDASMKSLKDKNAKDTFTVSISDPQYAAQFSLLCQGGKNKFFVLTINEECGVGGKGQVLNTKTNQMVQHVEYSGGYMVPKDGAVDPTTLKVVYSPIGNYKPLPATFAGDLKLKPDVPSGIAAHIRDMALAKYKEKTGGSGVIDDRIDTVEFDHLAIPSIGLPSDPGCIWTGSHVYSYQTSSWLIQATGRCGDKDYKLSGNLAWIDVSDEKAKYSLNLVLDTGATAQTDADVFVAESDSDIFADANGIVGTIDIDESGFVTVQVDGKPEELASQMKATGTFTGTGIPLPVVRSYVTIFSVLSRTFFGA